MTPISMAPVVIDGKTYLSNDIKRVVNPAEFVSVLQTAAEIERVGEAIRADPTWPCFGNLRPR